MCLFRAGLGDVELYITDELRCYRAVCGIASVQHFPGSFLVFFRIAETLVALCYRLLEQCKSSEIKSWDIE